MVKNSGKLHAEQIKEYILPTTETGLGQVVNNSS